MNARAVLGVWGVFMGADGDTALIISAAALAGALLVLAVIHIAVMRQQQAEKLSEQLAQALRKLDEGERSGGATVGGVDGTPPRNRPIRRKKKKPSKLMVRQKQIYRHTAQVAVTEPVSATIGL